MLDDPKMVPLSGEIMTGASTARRAVATGMGDVVDAEFVSVTRAERLAPADLPATDAAPRRGMDILTTPSAARPRFSRGGVGFWAGGLTLAAAAFWISGGHVLATRPAASAGTATVRVANVSSRVVEARGRSQIVVDGMLDNPGARHAALPDVTIHVTGGDGRTTLYRLGAGGGDLAAGGQWPFSGRLEAPASGVRSISVSLARKDL